MGPLAQQPRIAIMASPGGGYVSGVFAAWLVGGIAVPLCPSHPDKEIEYLLNNCRASVVLSDKVHLERMNQLGKKLRIPTKQISASPLHKELGALSVGKLVDLSIDGLQNIQGELGALLIYTSGTTGRPKGVLHTHNSLGAQVHSLSVAWNMSSKDRVLHSLPLHHIHGVVNALFCPLFNGGIVEMLPKFSVHSVWGALTRKTDNLSVYMGVPTMYSFLANLYESESEVFQSQALKGLRSLRLSICGSAACPLPLMEKWRSISGEYPLERYGMSETGMILGNPLDPELRRPGTVGFPFPGMEVEVRDDGQIFCRGRQLFAGYWGMPETTRRNFDLDGWFSTGDTGKKDRDGYVSLLGRTSADVIKRGGYKISALQIESTILSHESVKDCSVFGIADDIYGEEIVAVISGGEDLHSIGDHDLRIWLQTLLPEYQVPKYFVRLDQIPRNTMGKVNKISLREHVLSKILR